VTVFTAFVTNAGTAPVYMPYPSPASAPVPSKTLPGLLTT
jgi:hypothetical protein